MGRGVSDELLRMTAAIKRARNVFLMAVGVCVILSLNLAFFRGDATGALAGLRSSYEPLLLWGLTAAAYAFHTVARATIGLTEEVSKIRTAERMRELRQLAMIKERLRHSAGSRGT